MRIKQEESEIQSIRFRTTQAARSMLSVLNRKMLTLVSHCADMLELCFDDADAVINCCKLKTHGMMGMTCAVKNMYGMVPGSVKSEYHYRYSDPLDFAPA